MLSHHVVHKSADSHTAAVEVDFELVANCIYRTKNVLHFSASFNRREWIQQAWRRWNRARDNVGGGFGAGQLSVVWELACYLLAIKLQHLSSTWSGYLWAYFETAKMKVRPAKFLHLQPITDKMGVPISSCQMLGNIPCLLETQGKGSLVSILWSHEGFLSGVASAFVDPLLLLL